MRDDLVFAWAMAQGLLKDEPDWKAIRMSYAKVYPGIRGRKRSVEEEMTLLCQAGQSVFAIIPQARIVIGPLRGREEIEEVHWKAKRMDATVIWVTSMPKPGLNTWVQKQIHELEIGFWMRN